jgi:hypothetical protein
MSSIFLYVPAFSHLVGLATELGARANGMMRWPQPLSITPIGYRCAGTDPTRGRRRQPPNPRRAGRGEIVLDTRQMIPPAF